MQKVGDVYECEVCHGAFEAMRSGEELSAEALETFGVQDAHSNSGMGLVCDECYKDVMEWIFPMSISGSPNS